MCFRSPLCDTILTPVEQSIVKCKTLVCVFLMTYDTPLKPDLRVYSMILPVYVIVGSEGLKGRENRERCVSVVYMCT